MPIEFETQPVAKLFTKLAIPSVIAMVLNGATHTLATLLAAPLGQDSVAIMGIVFSALSFIQAFGYTVALGGSTLVSPALSSQNSQQVSAYAKATLRLDLALGLGITLLGLWFSAPILTLLGAPKPLLSLGCSYARYIFLSAPFVCGNYAFTCLLRCVGRSRAAMVGMVTGAVITVALTPVLFFVIPLGVTGSSIAFLVGQGVGFFILLVFYKRTPAFAQKVTAICKKVYLQIPYYGMASFLRQGLASLSLILLNRMAKQYGTSLTAALSVASRITGLFYSALLGWGQGFAPLAGYAFGKGRGESIEKGLSFGLKTAVVAMSIGGVALALGAYHATPMVKWCLLSQAVSFPFIPLGVFATYGYQSVKKPFAASFLSCLRQGICLIPLLFLLPWFWQEKGLLPAQGIADILTFFIALLFYRRLKKQLSCFSPQEVV